MFGNFLYTFAVDNGCDIYYPKKIIQQGCFIVDIEWTQDIRECVKWSNKKTMLPLMNEYNGTVIGIGSDFRKIPDDKRL